jgi:hypothetical protein
VSTPTGDPNLTNNTSVPVITTVTRWPMWVLARLHRFSVSLCGVSNLTYTISVTNFGPSSASGVVVTDSLAGHCNLRERDSGGGLEQQRYRQLELGCA